MVITGPTVRGGTPVFSRNRAPKAKYKPMAIAATKVTRRRLDGCEHFQRALQNPHVGSRFNHWLTCNHRFRYRLGCLGRSSW